MVVMSLLMKLYDLFTQILQGYFTGSGVNFWLSRRQWSDPEEYGKNQPVPNGTKAQTMCIFHGVYIFVVVYHKG